MALKATTLNSAVLKEVELEEVELKEQLISLHFFQQYLKCHLEYDNVGMLSVTAIADGLSHQSFKVCFKVRSVKHIFFVKCFTEKNADTRNTEINVTKVTGRAGLSPKVVYADDQFLITEFIDGNTLESIPLVTQEKVHHCLSLMEQLHQINHDDIAVNSLTPFIINEFDPSDILNSLIKALALSEQEVVQEIADDVLLLMPKVDKNQQVLCHGDMNFSNVFVGTVINENKLYLLDFECACVAEAEFDIAMMIAVNSLPVDVVFKHSYLAGLSKRRITRYLLLSLFINGLWYFNAACNHRGKIKKQRLLSLAKAQFIRFDSLNLIEESLASVLNFECKI